MAPNPRLEPSTPNPFAELVEALADRHGELDLRLDHLTLRVPLVREPIEVNGQVTVSLHLRDLSPKEKAARSAREIRLLEP